MKFERNVKDESEEIIYDIYIADWEIAAILAGVAVAIAAWCYFI